MKPRLLDLFCCSGGASVGYARAGFDVIGVDLADRPRYPFEFIQGDAVEYLARIIATGQVADYDLIHASPPCQAYCSLTKGTHRDRPNTHPELYEPIRDLLDASGVPAVIENPAARPDVILCGESFGLGVIRHRNFELINWFSMALPHAPHRGRVRGWRHGEYFKGPYVAAYGKGGGKGDVAELQAAMGIDWTDVRAELVEAIPPAYTQWLGEQALDQFAKWAPAMT